MDVVDGGFDAALFGGGATGAFFGATLFEGGGPALAFDGAALFEGGGPALAFGGAALFEGSGALAAFSAALVAGGLAFFGAALVAGGAALASAAPVAGGVALFGAALVAGGAALAVFGATFVGLAFDGVSFFFGATFFAGAFGLPMRAKSTISSEMRIAFALLLVIAVACKSKSADKSPDPTAPPIAGQPSRQGEGSGSAPGGPFKETPIGKKDLFAQQATLSTPDAGEAPPSDLPPTLDHGSGSGKAPAGKITIASKTSFDTTDLSADAVAEKIKRDHLAALGNCYRATLARDTKIAGKATLALTVKLDGAVTGAKASAPDPTLQSCFVQSMQTWTFPVPKNKDKEPTEASFQVALSLVPE